MRTTSAPERRRRVAAVEEAVDGDGGDPVANAQLDAGQQVPVERVDAARDRAGPTRCRVPPVCRRLAHSSTNGWNLVELAALDALGDADQVLGHHPAGAEVQVAHLAVAHLPFRQADGQAAGLEQGARSTTPRAGARPGVEASSMALPSRSVPVAPAVQHDQDDPVPGASV